MRILSFVLLLSLGAILRAQDLANLAPNTWVKLKLTVEQPEGVGADEKGQYCADGWNKLVYDPLGKRVLFYDRWLDKKHGGYTIYGNCLFSYDPAAGKLQPVKLDNWGKIDKDGGYRTVVLPENEKTPTPCPRHVYNCFEYIPELKSLFLCNGANGSAQDGSKFGSDLCEDTWRLDVEKKVWTKVNSTQHPKNYPLDAGMAYCPDTKSIVMTMAGSIWILDVASGQWRKAKNSTPACGMGQTVAYDPLRKRMILAGGPTSDLSAPAPANGRNETAGMKIYAFDPKTETVTKLADCSTPLYEMALTYDAKHDLFFVANYMKEGESFPSGLFAYDPKKDAWSEAKTANRPPDAKSWFGWVRMCYDIEHDCFIGMVRNGTNYETEFYALRYVPQK